MHTIRRWSVYLKDNFTLHFALADFILLNLAFFAVNQLKRGTLQITDIYLNLLLLLYAVWIIVGSITSKFSLDQYPGHKSAILILGKAMIFHTYLLAFILVALQWYNFSRVQLFSTLGLWYLLELSAFSVFYLVIGRSITANRPRAGARATRIKNLSLTLLLNDWAIMALAFWLVNYLKRDSWTFSAEYEAMLYLAFALWIGTGFFTRKFDRRQYRNFWYAVAPVVKSFLLNVFVMAVLIFALRLFWYSRLQVFGSFALAFALEVIFYWFWFRSGLAAKGQGDVESVDEVRKVLQQEDLPQELHAIARARDREVQPVADELHRRYLSGQPLLAAFLSRNLDLPRIDREDTRVIDTRTAYNVEVLEDHSLRLFINLHLVNDFRWLNRYFLTVHRKIYNGGYLVGSVRTIATHRKAFFDKFPWPIGQLLYPMDFLLRRVFPKLPVLRDIYFLITRGRGRSLSKTEVFGRLYFCGFQIVAEEVIDDRLHFIAQRVKTPSLERNPSYGPTIRLRRIGYNGEILYIRKLRTMHPYSEFLQDYIYQNNNLAQSGKFKDDFRVTHWGQIMRRLWLDELPQLINFFRGDVNLVGVRALSEHYFSLYPKDLQELRVKFKPGLVPPYYADMPKNFEEIVASERQYLECKLKHPVTTDLRYFGRAFYNILFKKARSQ